MKSTLVLLQGMFADMGAAGLATAKPERGLSALEAALAPPARETRPAFVQV